MGHRLMLFGEPVEAATAEAKSSVDAELHSLDAGGWYLKKPGRPNVEPRYLCADGHWRVYDAIIDLPHSTAQDELAAEIARGGT